ncbi:hypothetical protein, partial [Actinophytocola sp. NPDC049390]|uniref:hypothetical protein n=1 Tax=Actinophytocola sp. NPDC049390 TaxID=3363894 RepID=UPI0037A19F25
MTAVKPSGGRDPQVQPAPIRVRAGAAARGRKGAALLGIFRTTDPKLIGVLYLVTSFVFFMTGGV